MSCGSSLSVLPIYTTYTLVVVVLETRDIDMKRNKKSLKRNVLKEGIFASQKVGVVNCKKQGKFKEEFM